MVDFLKYWKIYLAFSSIVIILGLFSIVKWGYIYSIDFTGGTNLEYRFSRQISDKQIQKSISQMGLESTQIEERSDNTYLIKLSAINERKELQLRQNLEEKNSTKIEVVRTETVGPLIGAETLRKTSIAAGIAIIGILFYVAYAFKNLNFALAAVAALFHDILVVIGIYSIISHFFGAELDTMFVTALLTTMSFSVHDTIVVFDQIRDYQKRYGPGHIKEYANRAVTETMVRSLNNSFTVVFMLVALILLGGSTIRFFAAALLTGMLTGTYSSPFVSVPIAVWLDKVRKK